MKLNHQESEVLTNSTRESKFTINASAQAFKILSSGIYEHKIAAIVRELSCNAYDAHVEAGNVDRPFKVVLPNALHPYFEIEDYGIGLDDEGVRTVYTSYFTSTKQNSNDSIGAFGLGSKTPFSYTNTFNIRSRKDGVERLYSAYLGSDHAPAVNLLSERETDEENGIKITVPVRDEHFSRFRHEAEFILSMFKVKPIVPDPTFDFIASDVADELETGKIVVKRIVGNASQLYTSRFYAVMGGVCYGIDWNTISSSLSDSHLNYLKKVVIGDMYSYGNSTSNVIFMQFEIGELEPAASRETLSMTPETELLVKERVEAAVDLLTQQDQQEAEDSGHPIRAIQFINQKYDMGDLVLPMFTYQDVKLNHYNLKWFTFFRRISQFTGFAKRNSRINAFAVRSLKDVIPQGDRQLRIVYVPKGSPSVGFVKYSKLYLDSLNSSDQIIVLKDPINDRVRKRFEQYIGIDVEWRSLDDLKDKYKPAQSITKPTYTKRQPVQDKPKKIEIYGKHLQWDPIENKLKNKGSGRVDCKATKVFYVNNMYNIDDMIYRGSLLIGENNIGTLRTVHITTILEAIGMNSPIVIMKRNGNNETKMKEHNIKSISVLIEQFKKEINVSPEEIAYQSMHNSFGVIGNLNIHKIYESSNPKVRIKGYENEVIPSDYLPILTTIFEKEVDQERSKIDRNTTTELAAQQLIEVYPLLDHVYNKQGVYECVKEYVSLIDSKPEDV